MRARSPRCDSSMRSNADQVTGRIIVVPVISAEAAWATTRLWPSGVNFNRSFPGRPDGPPNELLADYFTRVLFPMADVVIDMHSGGNAFWFLPCSHMHVVDDPKQRKAMLDGMLAWNSDFHFLYIDVNGAGLLPVEAENQGKTVITTELGGGGRVPAAVHQLAWSGLDQRSPPRRGSQGESRNSRITGTSTGNHHRRPGSRQLCQYRRSRVSGKTCSKRALQVKTGDPIGRLWFPATPERKPRIFTAPLDGILTVIRATTPTLAGDSVFVLGQPIEAEELF